MCLGARTLFPGERKTSPMEMPQKMKNKMVSNLLFFCFQAVYNWNGQKIPENIINEISLEPIKQTMMQESKVTLNIGLVQ